MEYGCCKITVKEKDDLVRILSALISAGIDAKRVEYAPEGEYIIIIDSWLPGVTIKAYYRQVCDNCNAPYPVTDEIIMQENSNLCAGCYRVNKNI